MDWQQHLTIHCIRVFFYSFLCRRSVDSDKKSKTKASIKNVVQMKSLVEIHSDQISMKSIWYINEIGND